MSRLRLFDIFFLFRYANELEVVEGGNEYAYGHAVAATHRASRQDALEHFDLGTMGRAEYVSESLDMRVIGDCSFAGVKCGHRWCEVWSSLV